MKIAFIIKNYEIAEPLGIMYISSLLKTKGHSIALFIASRKNWLHGLKNYSPDIVGYSVISGSHAEYLKINDQVKAEIKAFSILGGPHTTFFPETVYQENVDAICIGEGGYPMLELAESIEQETDISGINNLWVKKAGTVIKNPIRPLLEDLNELPFPDRDLVYTKDKYLRENKIKRFISNSGCPFNCTYCFNRAYKKLYKGNKIIRWRSVQNVIEEIREVKNRYPLEVVRFIDDIFILPPVSWLEEFKNLYKQEINLPFVCNLQVKLVTDEKIRLIKEAGCMSVYMAIEAGNDKIRTELLERNMTKEEMINAFNLVHKYNIPIGAENILGLPEGSFETDMETLQLNIKCKVDNAISTLFQPYPKTKLGEYTIEKGYFDGNFDLLSESYLQGSRLNCFSNKDKNKIENLHKFFGFAVNHPSFLPLIKILIVLPPNKLFRLFHRLWDSYCKRRRIFNIRFTIKDYLSALLRVLRY